MQIKTTFNVTMSFNTIEDVPESFEGFAQRLIETQDYTLTPVREHMEVIMETEFEAENLIMENFEVKFEPVIEEREEEKCQE